jgi:hypothetical protein
MPGYHGHNFPHDGSSTLSLVMLVALAGLVIDSVALHFERTQQAVTDTAPLPGNYLYRAFDAPCRIPTLVG